MDLDNVREEEDNEQDGSNNDEGGHDAHELSPHSRPLLGSNGAGAAGFRSRHDGDDDDDRTETSDADRRNMFHNSGLKLQHATSEASSANKKPVKAYATSTVTIKM